MFEFDPRFRHYNSGFALTTGSGVVGTWVPAGTHRISENLGTDGYQVPGKFSHMPTPGQHLQS